MESIIEARGLTKYYGRQRDRAAVADLDLSIADGRLYGLVGPDGAGKTTTLRMLSTVMSFNQGNCTIGGYDIKSKPEKVRSLVGYMPQNFSLYPDLTVIENLAFFADIHQVPGNCKRDRMQEMLAFTRLDRFQKRRAGQLSGGMKKKLALACALIHDPALLLLDEPSTGVDPVSRRELWIILSELVKRGVTVLVSTPYMDEAERCHQVGMIYEGKLLTSGAPQALEQELPFEIVEVKAKPRKAMRKIVAETSGVADWRPVGDRLRLAIPNSNNQVRKVMKTLETRFRSEALQVNILRHSKKSMEDVFVQLVSKERGDR